MNPEFTSNVQKWVALDNELKGAQDTVKQLRDRRNQLAENILEVVDTSNLGNATVKISDGKLRFVETRHVQPVTLKLVEECLSKCIQSPESVRKIMQFIKDSRDVSVTNDIKRTYAKTD